MFDGVTNKLRDIIVMQILSRAIGYISRKGHINTKMSVDLNSAFYIRIIVMSCLVFSVHSLTKGLFKKMREQIEREIKDLFLDKSFQLVEALSCPDKINVSWESSNAGSKVSSGKGTS